MRLLTPRAGVKGRRIRELTSVVQKRFKFPEGSVELYAEKVRGPHALAHASAARNRPARPGLGASASQCRAVRWKSAGYATSLASFLFSGSLRSPRPKAGLACWFAGVPLLFLRRSFLRCCCGLPDHAS